MSRLRKSAALFGIALLAVAACGSSSKGATPTTAVTTTTATTAVASSTAVPTTGATTTTTASSATTTADTANATATTGTAGTSAATTPNTATSTSSDFSVEAANGTVTLKAKPVKIVSLSPTHTEVLFAIGAGSQVIAVDDQSNYPADALKVKSNLSGYTPNVEAIAGYKPDLVIISTDTDGLSKQLVALGIPVWVGPAASTLDDVYSQIEQLGVLTDHIAGAAGLVGNMKTDIAKIVAGAPKTAAPLTYYHELDNTLFSVTSKTFIGQLYGMVGLKNIADGADPGNDYPQLNAEFVIKANPNLIFLADTKCCGESAKTVAGRDGWSTIAAVKNGGVIAMDDDIASRWGPRIVDYLQAVVDAVKTAAAVPAG